MYRHAKIIKLIYIMADKEKNILKVKGR